jgi:hypothetical protein
MRRWYRDGFTNGAAWRLSWRFWAGWAAVLAWGTALELTGHFGLDGSLSDLLTLAVVAGFAAMVVWTSRHIGP